MKKVVVSGGFDPVHIGHLRMFQEAKKLGDYLTVILNSDIFLEKKKGYVFMSYEERKEIIENDLKAEKLDNSKITILSVQGLLTEFAKSHNANCIIRGLRAVSDFEYEFQMTGMNYQLSPDIETVFLMSSDNNSFISSNLVKEVHKLGGDVSKFVSKNTIKILNRKNS